MSDQAATETLGQTTASGPMLEPPQSVTAPLPSEAAPPAPVIPNPLAPISGPDDPRLKLGFAVPIPARVEPPMDALVDPKDKIRKDNRQRARELGLNDQRVANVLLFEQGERIEQKLDQLLSLLTAPAPEKPKGK